MATVVIGPVVVAVAGAVTGLAVTGGFSWVADAVKGDDGPPPVYVSGERSPRAVESKAPAASEDLARGKGLDLQRPLYLCPWDARVVKTPPGKLVAPPVRGRALDSSRVSSRNAGDPDRTTITLYIQPEGNRPLVVREIRIKVVARAPVPAQGEATVLGLQTAGCGGAEETVTARADLDGGGPYARVVPTGKTAFPLEITGGRTLAVDLTVATKHCDCTWVPEIVWAKDGEAHTTPWLDKGDLPFRTIPSAGYRRVAWKLLYANDIADPGLTEDKWVPVPFDERILE
ncbi:hypothetical protein AF335_20800 [Streptomyces eurocidicus]|uniref:Uncharacterized protein n=1 Tax=Streptomyces eurocidicus TaxID=66423 RepID=A0A2N8NTR8_STREU|nr:hypothetical protein [Streptomyces eurocidicus]MBB5119381.1 hypothetical protein [Streptomyces eurocidicus]MBF6053040.1 hypothetical protein [Streptomyces eurocidicus]PNE32166.1 hypothetical protein AF335_20800 [Streptomyces eurocidicus]